MRQLAGIIDSMHMSLGKLWEIVKDRHAGMLQPMELQRVRHDLVTEKQCVFLHRTALNKASHQRRHDKGEGLAVEVVQAVASKHGREDHGSVIPVASGCHGGKEQALLAGTQSL